MGLGNAKPDTPKAHRCINHADRFAAVTTNQGGLCWECYLGDDVYKKRFKSDYYSPQNSCSLHSE